MTTSSQRLSWAVRSDVGRVRDVNQDAASASPELFVVADGMGGHRGGEVASTVAVEAMTEGDGGLDSIESLVALVRRANEAVLARATSDPALSGMGTTLCAMASLGADDDARLGLVNVGDSRIYRYAEGDLVQVSDDHSLVATLVREGHLTESEAAVHPQRNIVTRALGISADIEVDYWEMRARPGEYYLLCSDGLVDELSDSQIAAIFRRLDQPGEVVDELVRQANEAGARDNVTVLVVRVDAGKDGPVQEPDAAATSPAGGPSAHRRADAAADDTMSPMGEAAADPVADTDRGTRRRRFWPFRRPRIRNLILVGAIVVIVVVGVALIGVYARDNYFVGFDQDQVVVYQGRVDGVLWFDPTVEVHGSLLRGDLSDALELEVEGNPEFASLDDAVAYLDGLPDRLAPASE